jgi:hypothetical protein
MTKGDRRNFKLFARLQEGDKKYVQLFDAIDRQSEYNEGDLLEQFKGERFTRQFSVAKNYLYNYILKTLHVFHKDQYSELSTLMHQIQILMGKNLYDQAAKMVRKAKHLAERQERFQEILYLLEYERDILHRTVQSRQYLAFMQTIQESERHTLDKLTNLQKFNHLYDQIYSFMNRSNSARGAKEIAEVDEVLSNPLLADPENALSVRARLKMHDVLNDCYMAKSDFAACLENARLIIETYEKFPVIRVEKNIRYINTVSNLGVFNYLLGNLSEAVQMLDKLKELNTYSEYEDLRIFEKYFYFKIALCIEQGDVSTGKQTLALFEEELEKLSGKVVKSFELGMFYAASYFYVQASEPSEALPWINRILNEPKTELRTDLQCMARILNLVIHYDLGNRDFIEYDIKSTSRFLANRDRLFSYERTIIKYLRQLANIGPNESKKHVLISFKGEIAEIVENPAEKNAASLFDASIWIDSKLKGVSMFSTRKDEEEVEIS